MEENMQRSKRVEAKVTHSSLDCGGTERRKFQRVLICFSCGADGAAASGDDGASKSNKKPSPSHKILDMQTQLPPPTGWPNGGAGKKKKKIVLFWTELLHWCDVAWQIVNYITHHASRCWLTHSFFIKLVETVDFSSSSVNRSNLLPC